MSAQNVEDDDIYSYRSLSDIQKQILAILPIPSAVLSVIGSTVIIYMAIRSKKSKPWTPYNRLLIGMSVYDVITSIALAIAAFMNPKETSTKAFAFGNQATCSTIGFLNQISYSGVLYNAMLSFYFLLTARFAMKNERIAEKIEPVMHILCLGFPTVCAFFGLFMDVYAEPEVGIGCWVNNYPKRCGYGPEGTGEPCKAGMVAWIFGGWIGLFTMAALFVNNVVIWFFVRRQITSQLKNIGKRSATDIGELSQRSDLDDDDSSCQNQGDESIASPSIVSSIRTKLSRTKMSSSKGYIETEDGILKSSQKRRLKLVSSQAFLFVASYFICNFAAYILRLFESLAATYVGEMELPYHNFILLVLQAILFPLQGLLNMLVYIRPKYIKLRSEYRRETRLWAFRRTILGDSVQPTRSMNGDNHSIHQVAAMPKSKHNVSSLTHGSGNSDGEQRERYRRNRKGVRSSYGSKSRGSADLEAISEISQEEDDAGAPELPPQEDPATSPETAATKVAGRDADSPVLATPGSSRPKMVQMDGSIIGLETEQGEGGSQ